MEKQRDKQARRMQRKLNRQVGGPEIEGEDGALGEDGAPLDESLVPDDAAAPEAQDQNPEG